jgi:hypothetical protein
VLSKFLLSFFLNRKGNKKIKAVVKIRRNPRHYWAAKPKLLALSKMIKQCRKYKTPADIFEIARQTGVCLLPIRVGISTNFHKGHSPTVERLFVLAE